jgi:hypothetical protein
VDAIAEMQVSGDIGLCWFSASETSFNTLVKNTVDKLLGRKLKKNHDNRWFRTCESHSKEHILQWLKENTDETNATSLRFAAKLWHIILQAYPREVWARFVNARDGKPGATPLSEVTAYFGLPTATRRIDNKINISTTNKVSMFKKQLLRQVVYRLAEDGCFTEKFLHWMVLHRGLYTLENQKRNFDVSPVYNTVQNFRFDTRYDMPKKPKYV